MEFSARLFDPVKLKTDCLVLAVPGKGAPGDVAQAVDEAAGSPLATLGKEGELAKFLNTVELYRPGGLSARRLVLVSTGKKESLTPAEFGKLAARVASIIRKQSIKRAAVCLEGVNVPERDGSWCASELAKKVTESQYVFDQCKSEKSAHPKLTKLELHAPSSERAALDKGLKAGAAIARGINFARELGDLPANICTPSYLAGSARKLAKDSTKLSVKVLSEAKMKELKMGSLLSVTAGTDAPAKLIILEYNGGRKNDRPQVLVGKGVTFDSGGISLKPGGGMDEMKYDMCGAASVLGTMMAVSELNLAINLVGIVPAVENMPSGRATKPGDIVTSMSGQTIEVLNTDAEGRLILCDALTYAERYKPAAVVDIATLTGACVVALGHHATGLFSNNDELADALLKAGDTAGDKAWRLPIGEEYDKQLKSNFADMANIGGKGAGSITAACFLGRFTKSYPWAHLDIAGTGWKSGSHKGATGRPVSLLVEYLSAQSR